MPKSAPSFCRFCRAGGRATPSVEYVAPNGDGYCSADAQILFSTGIMLDRVNRNFTGTTRSLEPEFLKLFETGRPGGWTYDPRQHERHERNH